MRLYTPEEDRIIAEYVKQAAAKNEPVTRVLEKAAAAINERFGTNRSVKSVIDRYSLIKKKLQPQTNFLADAAYTPEEDEIIREHIVKALLHERKTLSEGAKSAAKEIKSRFGKTRTASAVASRWYRAIKDTLPDDLKEKLDAAAREIAAELINKRIRREVTASDIVDVAEKHNRNPLHVLGVYGNLHQEPTVGQMLALIEEIEDLRRQVTALRALNRNLIAQLASANRSRLRMLRLLQESKCVV